MVRYVGYINPVLLDWSFIIENKIEKVIQGCLGFGGWGLMQMPERMRFSVDR